MTLLCFPLQDSTGMKLWKKRWFVLSDMCLFYYRDDKEEGILGSILLPSFHISLLSVDDHINRKYSFKATHPNMRTYYFCTEAAKETESWMTVMTDAALVQTQPIKRLESVKAETRTPQDTNNMLNHRVLTSPEAQNNERNRGEPARRGGERYSVSKGAVETPLAKIDAGKLQPAPPITVPETVIVQEALVPQSSAPVPPPAVQHKVPQTNGPGEQTTEQVPEEVDSGPSQATLSQASASAPATAPKPERTVQRTGSMQQLERWVRTQRGQDEETHSIMSYQTLPRNMPSHRTQIAPRYPEGYRTLPRNSMARPESVCGVSPSLYERAPGPAGADKRRSLRDDTMWQLYEWQQRQAYGRQGPVGLYGTLPSPRTMFSLSEHAGPSIPPSPSHGSLALHHGYSPMRSYNVGSHSEVTSPVFSGDVSLERRRRPHITKCGYPPDRRSMPVGVPMRAVSPQSLQGKTTSPEDYRGSTYGYRSEDSDIDAKLSRLCEQDKVVRTQEEKLQQLHREKHTLETALLSASQEIQMNADKPAALTAVMQQRDVLQNGLLSTCRELSRVTTELEHSWRYYDKLESEVTLARSNLLEQLETLGTPQTEPPGQQHVQIQKELWRIQDVMEALSKNKPQRSTDSSDFLNSRPLSNQLKNEGPDYRMYKSEPELTAVAEVDETSGEDKAEQTEKEQSSTKGLPFPVGIVPPRTKSPMPESSTIASYVTLRKAKKPSARTDRPHSAVEQLSTGECPRPRMSLEEQLERIKRHQNASLKDKKKGMGVLGLEGSSPSRSLSFSKENPFRTLQPQSRRREETLSCDIHLLEASLREQELGKKLETPAQEIARLKGTTQATQGHSQQLETSDKSCVEPRSEGTSSPEEGGKQKKVDRIKAFIARNSMQNIMLTPVTVQREDGAEEVAAVQAQENIIDISYELAAEASKRSKLAAVKSLPSPPQSPTAPSPRPQLAEGSHFMCV